MDNPPAQASASWITPAEIPRTEADATVFDFDHKVFTMPEARFALRDTSTEPYFFLRLGELEVGMRLAALRAEFKIHQGTHDWELIATAEKALRYVKEIRPGDSIPREILDGTASWSVEERHRAIAKARLIAQVTTWITGRSAPSTAEGLLALAEDPANRELVQNAFGKLAETLGLGPDQKQEIIDRIDTCARELSYIEGLRDAVARVTMIRDKVCHLIRLYRRDRRMQEELQRVEILLKEPIQDFDQRFLEIDAQTGEILPVLKNIEGQVTFIRQNRDEIRYRLLAWGDIIGAWKDHRAERSVETEGLITLLYRFLASRYAPVHAWR